MPQDLLADGFIDLCIDPSLNFYSGKPCITVEGLTSSGTATADVRVPVQGLNDVVSKFGNSVLSSMLRHVFNTCPSGVQVYAVPRVGVGVVAQHTLTFTGPATSDGRIKIYLGDTDWLLDVYIPSGSTATQIAVLVSAEIPAEMPFTVVDAVGVITLTAESAGDLGNYFTALYNWENLDNVAPDGVAMAVANTVTGTTNPAALDWGTVMSGCCCDVFVSGFDDVILQEAIRSYLVDAWSCDTPQCFGHGYVFNCGTQGTINATGTNSAELSRMACCGTEATMPYNRLSAMAALRACSVVNNPELSIQGRTFGVLTSIKEPQGCTNCFTYDEQVALKASGFVVIGQLEQGSGSLTFPYVFNDVTNYLRDDLGRSNETYRDASSRFLVKATSLEISEFLQNNFNGLSLFTKSTTIKQGVFGTNQRLMLSAVRTWAKGLIGELFSEFGDIDSDIQITKDSEKQDPCLAKPGKMHLRFRYRPPVRISQIVTTVQPELFTECSR